MLNGSKKLSINFITPTKEFLQFLVEEKDRNLFMIFQKNTLRLNVSHMTIQKPLGFLCVTWPGMKLSKIRFSEKSLHGTSTR